MTSAPTVRQPSGVPVGGQFAPVTRGEAEVSLDGESESATIDFVHGDGTISSISRTVVATSKDSLDVLEQHEESGESSQEGPSYGYRHVRSNADGTFSVTQVSFAVAEDAPYKKAHSVHQVTMSSTTSDPDAPELRFDGEVHRDTLNVGLTLEEATAQARLGAEQELATDQLTVAAGAW